MDDWIYFTPNKNHVVSINTFDDGNDQYAYYSNRWYVVGKWRGKIALANAENQTIKIHSISEWKTIALASSR
jgi:hypothetical protein